ncbi:hypothetical protein OC861_004717 [Tilletia horrida]|nr:hypothetical protein OC861_004717 [Tilletia horrida]
MTASGGPSSSSASAAPGPSRTQTKLAIPFPDDSRSGGLSIAGILAHAEPLDVPHFALPSSSSSSGAGASADASQGSNTAALKPLALILHGVLAHKDQIYHKKLVAALDMDSFRFDFRANHETPGEWHMSNFHDDIKDMRCVISFLRRHLKYQVTVLIAHSRGALDSWTFLAEQERARRASSSTLASSSPEAALQVEVPRFFVSLSSRWRMERIKDRLPVYNEGFEKEGFYRWKARVAGKEVEARITPEMVTAFHQHPIPEYVRDAPVDTDVLLIQGTTDKVVPSSDIAYYANALNLQEGRKPGSVQMHLVEHADHNFVGHYDEVVDAIVRWLALRTSSGKTADKVGAMSSRSTAGAANVGKL